MDVLRVLLLRDWKISFLSQFSMGLDHPHITISNYWIKKLRDINLVPRSTEDQIAHQYLILECGPETSRLNTFLDCTFDSSSYSAHRSKLCASEFCSLKVRVEHTLHKCGVLMDFEWLAN